MKNKTSTTRRRRSATTPCSQFWVIDTDTPGMSQGQFSASGPYPTQKAAEAAIIADTRNLWEDSCPCLQTDKRDNWCKPLHIVQVIRTVQPEITAKVALVDTANDQGEAQPPAK